MDFADVYLVGKDFVTIIIGFANRYSGEKDIQMAKLVSSACGPADGAGARAEGTPASRRGCVPLPHPPSPTPLTVGGLFHMLF